MLISLSFKIKTQEQDKLHNTSFRNANDLIRKSDCVL